jgi:hypothetical protein
MGGSKGAAIAAGWFVLAAAAGARAEEVHFSPWDVQTVFYISKSDDRNRVDYAIRLDADCMPFGDAPVFPYWREFENSPPVRTHPISFVERVPYGISAQGLNKKNANGADFYVRLRQLDRVIGIATRKEADGKCSATPRATIGGIVAQLLSVFAKLAGPFSVDYIDVHGKDFASGAPIDERIKK